MKIIKSFLCIALSLSVVMVKASQSMSAESVPAHKRQRVAYSGKDEKEKVAQQQELGIQDTLTKFINLDPTKIVKAYLGWKHEHYDMRDKINLSKIDCDDYGHFNFAVGRDNQHNPILYIATENQYLYKFDLKTRNIVSIPIPCKVTENVRFDQGLGQELIAPRERNEPIWDILPLSPHLCMGRSWFDSLVQLFNQDKKVQELKAMGIGVSFQSLCGGINKKREPVAFIAQKDAEMARLGFIATDTPVIELLSGFPGVKTFLFKSSNPLGSCVGKSKNGDCIAYLVEKDFVAVFNLETGVLKTTFKCDYREAAKCELSLFCSANDEGCVAIGIYQQEVRIYDEEGMLLKEFANVDPCSVNLANKGRCIIGHEEGILQSCSIKSDEVQEIGTVNRNEGDWVCWPKTVMLNKPTTLVSSETIDEIHMWTDEAEAIEAYDAELKARSAQ